MIFRKNFICFRTRILAMLLILLGLFGGVAFAQKGTHFALEVGGYAGGMEVPIGKLMPIGCCPPVNRSFLPGGYVEGSILKKRQHFFGEMGVSASFFHLERFDIYEVRQQDVIVSFDHVRTLWAEMRVGGGFFSKTGKIGMGLFLHLGEEVFSYGDFDFEQYYNNSPGVIHNVAIEGSKNPYFTNFRPSLALNLRLNPPRWSGFGVNLGLNQGLYNMVAMRQIFPDLRRYRFTPIYASLGIRYSFRGRPPRE